MSTITTMSLTTLDDNATYGGGVYAISRQQWEESGCPLQIAIIPIPSTATTLDKIILEMAAGLAEEPAGAEAPSP